MQVKIGRRLIAVAAMVVTVTAVIVAYQAWRERYGYPVLPCAGGPPVGRRWNVDLQVVTSLEIAGNRLVVGGQRLRGGLGEWTSEASTAEHLHAEVIAPDKLWDLAGYRYTREGAEVRVFRWSDSRSECVLLPKGSARPMIASGQSRDGPVVVIAAGDWKTGPEAYVAVLEPK